MANAILIMKEVNMNEEVKAVEFGTNLNNAYVLVKTYNGSNYFKRRGYVTCLKEYPDNNCIYKTKEEAETALNQVNTNRTKCKFRLESATNYFITIYTAHSWENVIGTLPFSIKAIKDNVNLGYKRFLTYDEAAKFVKTELEKSIQYDNDESAKILKSVDEEVEKFKKSLIQRSDYRLDSAKKSRFKIAQIEQAKELVKQFESKADTMVKVLYAKSTTTSKQA